MLRALADFWRYGVAKSWRKAIAAILSPIYARFGRSSVQNPGAFMTRYGVKMLGNWGDRTFRYCMFATYGRDLSDILAAQKQDFQFIDIGANQGLYSLLAGMNPYCRKIVAFEPVPATFALLQGNVALNNQTDWTDLHELAISWDVGEAVIGVSHTHSGIASLVHSSSPTGSNSVTIQTVNAPILDRLLPAEWPCIVKVDVEGLEYQVITELTKSHSFRAVIGIFYEIDERWSDPQEIRTLLEAHGFLRFQVFGRGHHYDVYATRG